MTITDVDTVDAVGVDRKTGEVRLMVSDHLDWKDPAWHIECLTLKVRAYERFVASGQLAVQYPNAAQRLVVIDIYLMHPWPRTLRREWERIANEAATSGIRLTQHDNA